MNVKELILSQPAADIATALLDRLDVEPAKRDKGIRRITALIDTLRGMKPEATDYRLLGVYHMYEDKEFLDANLYCKSELPAELAPLPDVLAVKGIDELTVDETEQAARAIQLVLQHIYALKAMNKPLLIVQVRSHCLIKPSAIFPLRFRFACQKSRALF